MESKDLLFFLFFIADGFTADEVLYKWDIIMPLHISNDNIPLYDLLRKPTSANTCMHKNQAKGKISTTSTYRITGTR